eukprot:354643-Chlamydomonas_euryale.AAC.4
MEPGPICPLSHLRSRTFSSHPPPRCSPTMLAPPLQFRPHNVYMPCFLLSLPSPPLPNPPSAPAAATLPSPLQFCTHIESMPCFSLPFPSPPHPPLSTSPRHAPAVPAVPHAN